MVSLPEVEKRIENKDNKSEFVKSYDYDNLYPQNMEDIGNASGTTKSCVKLLAKFMRGKGFKDKDFYKAKINDSGMTADQLLRKVTEKFGFVPGYAIHVNYNANLKISEVKYIPFSYCRLGIEKEAGKIAVYDNWDGCNGKFDKTKIVYLNKFNPNPDVLLSEINGDIENYKGQVLWRSIAGADYPLSIFDPVVEDVVSDSNIKTFRLRNIRKGFNASTIVEYGYEPETEELIKEEVKRWGKFVGPDSSDVIVQFNKNGNDDKNSLRIHKLDVTNNDKMYEVTNKTVKDSIIQAFNQPPILLGISANGMFNSNEIEDSYKFYNSVTVDERIMLEEDFKMIFSNFQTNLNPSGDYSIEKLQFEESGFDKERANLALSILQTQLSELQKISSLKLLLDMTTEEAQSIVLGINTIQ